MRIRLSQLRQVIREEHRLALKENEEKGYQGWKNYETWAVALWLDNDQGTYEMVREWAQELKAGDEEQPREGIRRDVVIKLADMIKEWVESEDVKPDLGATMYSDLLNAALSEVDYWEIAEHSFAE